MTQNNHKTYLEELRRRIRNVYRQEGERGPGKRSQGEQLRALVKRRHRRPKPIPPDIELWLAFFDEAIAFWLVVWGFYRDKVKGPSDDRLICLTSLSGRVFQDLICVRSLVENGFFVQSNVVARSLVEAIDVMHLLNSHQQLAESFKKIIENDDASKFWHAHCSRGKVHKLVKARWLWFAEGDDGMASSFCGLREEYLDLIGMSAHPTFAASFVTFMDTSTTDSDSIVYNAMGSVSQMSKFTMHLILLRVFEYGILWSGPEIALYKNKDELRPQPYLFENISKGLSMMLSIVRTLDEQPKGDPFFPEFKTYWPLPERLKQPERSAKRIGQGAFSRSKE